MKFWKKGRKAGNRNVTPTTTNNRVRPQAKPAFVAEKQTETMEQNERTLPASKRNNHHDIGRVPLDPIITLQVGGDKTNTPSVLGQRALSSTSVTSVCFVHDLQYSGSQNRSANANEITTTATDKSTNIDDEVFDDDDDDTDDSLGVHLPLRTKQTILPRLNGMNNTVTGMQRSTAQQSAAAMSLSGVIVASCQTNGDSYVWDLGRRISIQPFAPNRGQGLLLRRMVDDDAISPVIFQTRDEKGMVSIHDVSVTAGQYQTVTVSSVETFSQSFCVAAPCRGNSNLIALPCEDETVAMVHDWRCPQRKNSANSTGRVFAGMIHGAGLGLDSDPNERRRCGMLTSLAMIQSPVSSTILLACGMEDGSIYYHDLRMMPATKTLGSISLGHDPILSLDIDHSCLAGDSDSGSSSSTTRDSYVTIAGMAGDAADQSMMDHPGTVAIVKSTGNMTTPPAVTGRTPQQSEINSLRSRVRAKLSTCQQYSGKPGVGICRFRPVDRQVFAVGGWDFRVRIYHRSTGMLLAILRGHTASVQALDWASDARTGWIVTGGSEGRIQVWQVLPF